MLQKNPSALVLDTGNALFKAPGLGDEEAKKRAAFVYQTMVELGTAAMAVGPRDLSGGLPFLVELSKANPKMKLLSANLRQEGKAPFEASTVVTVNGAKVGVIGVSGVGQMLGVETLMGSPLPAAIKAEAEKLKGKVDLIVVLSTASYADTMQAGVELKDQVDLFLQSGEQRASGLQRLEASLAMATGDRGRTLGQLDLDVGGKGAWVDLEQASREKELLKGVTGRLDEMKKRRALAKDAAAKKELDGTIAELDARVKEQSKKANADQVAGARTARLTWVNLDANIADDAALKKKVLVFEPTYAAPH